MSTAAEPEVRAQDESRPDAFKSRWGYHPCDRETFLALKEYHKLMLAAFRRYRRWAAWDRKTVHRVGPEPRKVERLTHKTWEAGAFRTELDGPIFARWNWPRGGDDLYHHVLEQYREARYPRPDPRMVGSLELPDGWRAEIETLRAELAALDAPAG